MLQFIASIWNGIKGVVGRLLGGRKIMYGIIVLAVYIIAIQKPELALRAGEIGGVLFAFYGVLVGGITLEDSVSKWVNRPQTLAAILALFAEELGATHPTVVKAQNIAAKNPQIVTVNADPTSVPPPKPEG